MIWMNRIWYIWFFSPFIDISSLARLVSLQQHSVSNSEWKGKTPLPPPWVLCWSSHILPEQWLGWMPEEVLLEWRLEWRNEWRSFQHQLVLEQIRELWWARNGKEVIVGTHQLRMDYCNIRQSGCTMEINAFSLDWSRSWFRTRFVC